MFVIVALSGRCPSVEASEVRLDREFLAGVLEKLPPSPFEKKGQYRGQVNHYRLLGIEPARRRLLVACQVEGEFRPPVSGPVSERLSRSPGHEDGLRKFRFAIKAGVNIEPGDGTPHFRVDVEEVKKGELEGLAGLMAKLLGRFFDDMVTQIADGRAALLNKKLNAEVLKRAAIFKEYGVFCGISYLPEQLVLRFDLTTLRREGIVGYVPQGPGADTVPLHRWLDRRWGGRYFTTGPRGPGRPAYVAEADACHVLQREAPGTVPVNRWYNGKDCLLTTDPRGTDLARLGFRPEGIAFYAAASPADGLVPLYRYYDSRRNVHFFTTHPHAEFMK